MTTTMARAEIRTMHPRGGEAFDRVYLFCPNGHEVVSAPVTNSTGVRLVAGDFDGQWCGYGSCGWEA